MKLHPSIIKNLDLKVESIFGFEIFLDNIPDSRKKIRELLNHNLLFPIIKKSD